MAAGSAGTQAVTDFRDYRQRAEQHAPVNTAEEMRAAAQNLLRDGFSDHGIAAALGLDVEAVRRLIGACPECNE